MSNSRPHGPWAGSRAVFSSRGKRARSPIWKEWSRRVKDAESNPEIKANDKNNEWGASLGLVEKALKALSAEKRSQLYDWITRDPWVLTALGFLLYFGILLLFWGLLLRHRPLLILKINDALSGYQGHKLPWGDLKITPRDAILARSFQYHPRVLDAWVAEHLAVYRENFRKLATVRDRSVHISVPVVLGDEVVPELKADRLKATFSREKACLLIWGEGGSGKTSLACQMAGWAMAQDEPDRLCQHPMLPVLIEEDLQPSAPAPTAGPIAPALTETIRGQVQLLTGKAEPPSAELSDRLLRRRRVLVIVDHLSEMGEATRSAVRPGQPDFPVNALIVTSRIRETLGNAISTATVVQPLRIEGNRLSSFMDAYLLQRGKRQLFDDREFFKACGQLTLIVGGSKSTVLLAKLFAEQLIGQRRGAQAGALPANVPDLMLGYVNELNRNIPDDDRRNDREVRRDAEALAWECLKPTYQPAPVARELALEALGGTRPRRGSPISRNASD